MKRFIAEIVLEPSRIPYMRSIYHIIKHPAYSIFVYCISVLDMANSALSVISEYVPVLLDNSTVFRSLNVVFVSIYILEVVTKVRISIVMRSSVVPKCQSKGYDV